MPRHARKWLPCVFACQVISRASPSIRLLFHCGLPERVLGPHRAGEDAQGQGEPRESTPVRARAADAHSHAVPPGTPTPHCTLVTRQTLFSSAARFRAGTTL